MASADRLIEVFNEARLRPAGAGREQWLDKACRDDAALREQVLSLLQADQGAGDYLKHAIPPATLLLTEKPGDRIGRYKLLQQIGEGGCGVVYMAEQEEPVRRRVALKVIKLGMDTKSVIARFEAERQALALMDHPNIAKVFDAGATDAGRPYFVMELVRGIRITDYCDQNNLSTEERLKLFTQVCHAIQHAHQKGIIHRDIKPSNILVSVSEPGSPGCPKVIDFGIAKATTDQRLTDKTVFTAFEQFIGTPAYMSPEQAMMTSLDIDTRTDIYALGVLLYELLTAKTPFDANELMAVGLDAMRRIIREQEPPRPSTRLSTMLEPDLSAIARHRRSEPAKLGTLLRGDLDWIVMKALEKDRTRRYETANGLAADIQRHLTHEPVNARPPSNLYRLQKLARRNQLAFAAVGAVMATLVFGVIVSSWQALRATRAERAQIKLRQEAEAAAAKSQQAAQFMQDMLKGVGPSAALGRDTKMLREILDKTAERITADLKDQPEVEAELRNAIGRVYWELGDFTQSWAMHNRALTIQRKLFGNEHPSVATSLHDLAQTLRQQARLAEAETASRESLAMRRKLLGHEHPAVAQSLNYLGSLLSIELKDGEPEALLREAVAIQRKVLGSEHGDVGTSLDNLAHVLNRRGQAAEATAMHYEALAIRKKFFGDQHPELIYSYRNLATVLREQGRLAEAETMARNAMLLCQKLLGEQHPQLAGTRRDLGSLLRAQGKSEEAESVESKPAEVSKAVAESLQEAGKYFQQRGMLAEAEANYREALAMKKQLSGDVHREIATSMASLAVVLHQERKSAEAVIVYREVLAMERKLSGEEHPLVASALHQLGEALQQQRKLPEAEAVWREELALLRKVHGKNSPEVAHTLHRLAILHRDQGKLTEAETMIRESLAIRRKRLGNEHLDVGHALHVLAWTLHLQGNDADAETFSREELALRRKQLGNEHHNVSRTLYDLTFFLRDQNKLAEAEATAREALAIRTKTSGNASPDIAAAQQILADVLARKEKLAQTEGAAREAKEKIRQRPP